MAVDSETRFKLDLLHALGWLRISWDNLTPTTIKHCYQHVGFKDFPATEETSAPDTSIWSSAEEAGLVSDGLSFEDFVALDDGVAIGPGVNGLEIDDIRQIGYSDLFCLPKRVSLNPMFTVYSFPFWCYSVKSVRTPIIKTLDQLTKSVVFYPIEFFPDKRKFYSGYLNIVLENGCHIPLYD